MRTTTMLVLVLAAGCAMADERTEPTSALEWKPREFPEATLHPRIPFLQEDRAWERMDVWVPREPAEGRLPCVVAVYGGGYGDKSRGFVGDFRPLLSRGFVVVAPDYALQTDAPVPLCSWDVARAIRWLRAHADDYRIDPERIALWGWSAGGWIGQDLCYTGPQRAVTREYRVGREKRLRWFPMLEPRPPHADQSVRVQAVVSDWGAGKLWDRRKLTPAAWLSPDDPPLFTCYNGTPTDETVNAVTLLRDLGVPARAVYGIEGNTHVPKVTAPARHEDGRATTWGGGIVEFLEAELKSPRIATAPEMLPHGGALDGPTAVRLLTVHPGGTIHYTLDGRPPDGSSPRYESPITVKPGTTLRAIVVREGLAPSRVTTGTFTAGVPVPRITTTERRFTATAGKPFRVAFLAENDADARWYVGGKTGDHFREYDGERFNPPRHVPWMSIDAETGVLSGTPRLPGVYPAIVSLSTVVEKRETPAIDAVYVVVVVE